MSTRQLPPGGRFTGSSSTYRTRCRSAEIIAIQDESHRLKEAKERGKRQFHPISPACANDIQGKRSWRPLRTSWLGGADPDARGVEGRV